MSRLFRGRSSQQGLPRPESWGRPSSFGPGALSFGSGRKGLTAVPLRVSPALQSLWFCGTGPQRSRGCPRALTYAYSHPTPGLYSHARPRRAPRTQRTPSCRTSRTTHAPPQCGVESSQRRALDSDSGAHVDPSTELVVWCDFNSPILPDITEERKDFFAELYLTYWPIGQCS